MFFFFDQFLFVKHGWTALHHAADYGFEEVANILLEHGSSVDLQDEVLIFFFCLFSFLFVVVKFLDVHVVLLVV